MLSRLGMEGRDEQGRAQVGHSGAHLGQGGVPGLPGTHLLELALVGLARETVEQSQCGQAGCSQQSPDEAWARQALQCLELSYQLHPPHCFQSLPQGWQWGAGMGWCSRFPRSWALQRSLPPLLGFGGGHAPAAAQCTGLWSQPAPCHAPAGAAAGGSAPRSHGWQL